MSVWLMIGTAPSVERTLVPVRRAIGPDKVITTNGGIRLEPNPDIYVLVDRIASVHYHEDAKAAHAAGSRLVTLHRDCQRGQRDRKVDWFDEFVQLRKQSRERTRDGFGPFQYSGPFCCEYACHHGATQIHLVGCDGYRRQDDYTPLVDNPIKRTARDIVTEGVCRTAEVLAPGFRDVAKVWHDVEFIQYGDPCFDVHLDNWRVEKW